MPGRFKPGPGDPLNEKDLVRENVMVDGDKLQLIDFDDGGFGFNLYDLATTQRCAMHVL